MQDYIRESLQVMKSVKVSDMDPDLSITENEIPPLIYEAADNCSLTVI